VVRNRLKRQLRSLVSAGQIPWRAGVDVIIVAHPARIPITSAELKRELAQLCKRAGAAS
jgi:ribonuclease P protein component